MLFNSYSFIFFYLPAVFFGFFRIARTSHRLAALWLGAASLFFYGWWNPQFVLLLLASIVFNYAMGYAIGHAREKPRVHLTLAFAITINLVILGIFKYANFFSSTLNDTIGTNLSVTNIVLPLGISFFTFTQIAFLIDVHRGIAREYNFIHYILFVTYFPHLIAGPVLHHKQMMPQFAAPSTYRVKLDDVAIGFAIFTIGLAKKVLLADNFASYVVPVFDAAQDGTPLHFFTAWKGVFSYSFQLYFDFSGYSDMAIGLSRLFGVHLPLNFNSPYKAHNIIEFWRRWHMTLSLFLRDYLYIPLGGGRKGNVRRHVNLMITMLLGGLWHGANWTFVVWGGLHGLYLVANHGWHEIRECMGFARASDTWAAKACGTILTFVLVAFAWIFFRSETWSAALGIVNSCAGLNGGMRLQWTSETRVFINVLITGLFLVWALPNTQQLVPWIFERKRPAMLFSVIGLLFAIVFIFALTRINRVSPFLYFQF